MAHCIVVPGILILWWCISHLSVIKNEERKPGQYQINFHRQPKAGTNIKYIVLGDFNAVSPFDADLYRGNESLLTSMRASEKEHEHVRNLFQGQLEYGVLSTFLGYPLLDVTQIYTSGLEARLTSPTRIFNRQIKNDKNPNAKRIDYILVSPYLQTTSINARVLNGKETFYLSDHYPVMAEFGL